MPQKFGIGIVGCGGISSSHIEAYQQLHEQCTVVAACDPVEASAARAAERYGISVRYTDHRRLLADDRVHLVSVCVPHFLHAPITVDAARAGKHVIVEKPMALTTGEATEMIEAARASGVMLTVGSERINPRYRFIRNRVLPEIGRVRFSWLTDFYYRDSAYYSRGPWRGKWAKEGGGIFANQAIYTWDQWQDLLGGVDLAYGYWTNILHPEIEVEDIGYGLVFFHNGSHGKAFATSACEPIENGQGIRILGEQGEIATDSAWLYQLDFSLQDQKAEAALRRDFARAVDPSYIGRYQHWQAADFFDAIRSGRQPVVTPESAREALKILNGIHWHGWLHAKRFLEWARSVDDFGRFKDAAEAKHGGWRGGKLVPRLLEFVRTDSRTLDAPFLARD
ncbi:MAG: Gfo/Idh/MocA family oxidoreductase [Planctomycetes bacterium]|nr:Gfo/Idh/MocA family oxidoreductase [Planctomycetota bacterium]